MAKKIKTQEASELMKGYGDVVFSGQDILDVDLKIIPTTISLDIALGGGLLEGTITNISGLPKCGKSTLVLEIIKNAQQLYKKPAFYMDVEARLGISLLKCINGLVWNDEQEAATGIPQLRVIRSAHGQILAAEDYLNIAYDLHREYPGCITILDSVAALSPRDALDKKIGENAKMMGVSQLMYQFYRKMNPIVQITKSNLITITHIQSSPNPYDARPEVGGNALQYFTSNRLKCLSSQEFPKDSNPKKGRQSTFKITASAIGSPGGDATIHVRYGQGCDNIAELIDIAITLGIIVQGGPYFTITNLESEIKVQGKEKLYETLKSDDKIRSTIEQDIRKTFLGDK